MQRISSQRSSAPSVGTLCRDDSCRGWYGVGHVHENRSVAGRLFRAILVAINARSNSVATKLDGGSVAGFTILEPMPEVGDAPRTWNWRTIVFVAMPDGNKPRRRRPGRTGRASRAVRKS